MKAIDGLSQAGLVIAFPNVSADILADMCWSGLVISLELQNLNLIALKD